MSITNAVLENGPKSLCDQNYLTCLPVLVFSSSLTTTLTCGSTSVQTGGVAVLKLEEFKWLSKPKYLNYK